MIDHTVSVGEHNGSVRETISRRILSLRTKQGLSQSEFARQVGAPRSTVHAWESGRNKPDEDTFPKVAAVLNTSISYLFGETNDPRPAPDWQAGQGPASDRDFGREEVRELLKTALKKLDERD